MTTFVDRETKKSGRLPLILLGIFAAACLVGLFFVGDLARYQETAMVGESQAALRDVDDPSQLDQALKRYPSNRILKLVTLARDDLEALDAATRKLLGEAGPPALAKPVNLTTASRGDLDALRRDLKTAEGNLATLASRTGALTKERRSEVEGKARALGVESDTLKRFMTAVDEQHADIAALLSRMLAARTEYCAAYERSTALLVKEFGTYKVVNGQFIFRLQPTADSYNAASVAMTAASKRLAELELERGALRASMLNRWKKFVGS